MTLYITAGNLFESNCEWIGCTVNCVGIMGKGLALETKQRFPTVAKIYEKTCAIRGLAPGEILAIRRNRNPSILCIATKLHWVNPSQLVWIRTAVTAIKTFCRQYSVKSLALPALGCKNGGLLWKDVLPIMLELNTIQETQIWIYQPRET